MEDLNHLIWRYNFSYLVWNNFLEEFGFSLARPRDVSAQLEELFTLSPFRGKGPFLSYKKRGVFFGLPEFVLFYEVCG